MKTSKESEKLNAVKKDIAIWRKMHPDEEIPEFLLKVLARVVKQMAMSDETQSQ